MAKKKAVKKSESEIYVMGLMANMHWMAVEAIRQLETSSFSLFSPYDVANTCSYGTILFYNCRKYFQDIWKETCEEITGLDEVQFPEGSEDMSYDLPRPWVPWDYILDKQLAWATGAAEEVVFFRERLGKLKRYCVGDDLLNYGDEHESDWRKLGKDKDWVKEFIDGSINALVDLRDRLFSALMKADPNEHPEARLRVIEYKLGVFQLIFFNSAEAIIPCTTATNKNEHCSAIWTDGVLEENNSMSSLSGALRLRWRGDGFGLLQYDFVRGEVSCRFIPAGEQAKKAIEWKLEKCPAICGHGKNEPNSFKDRLFLTWDYSTGECLVSNDTVLATPHWYVYNPEVLNNIADSLYGSLLQMVVNKNYEPMARRGMRLILNGKPEWRPGKVQWSYIKELDEMILECTRERDIYQIKQDKKMKLGSFTIETKHPFSDPTPPMSLSDISELLAKDVRTIQKWIDSGAMPAFKFPGKSKFYKFQMSWFAPEIREKIRKKYIKMTLKNDKLDTQ